MPVLRQGYRDLRAGNVTLNLSMSVGILAALATGETFTSALMTLVVLISEQLEVCVCVCVSVPVSVSARVRLCVYLSHTQPLHERGHPGRARHGGDLH